MFHNGIISCVVKAIYLSITVLLDSLIFWGIFQWMNGLCLDLSIFIRKVPNILHNLQGWIMIFFLTLNPFFQSIRFHASVLTSGGGTAKQTSSSIILFVLLHPQYLLSPFIHPICLFICTFVPLGERHFPSDHVNFLIYSRVNLYSSCFPPLLVWF